MPVNTLNGNDLPPVDADQGQPNVEDNEVTVDDFQAIPRVLLPAAQFLKDVATNVSLFYTATNWN